MPEVVPATALESGDSGVKLTVLVDTVPAGGRRAGLTSHWFRPQMVGQEQRVHTGWLQSDGSDRVEYAPHTKAGDPAALRLAFTARAARSPSG